MTSPQAQPTFSRAALLASRDSRWYGYSVESDGGAHFDVLSVDADQRGGFGHSRMSGMLVRFDVTGRSVQKECVRVKVRCAVDPGQANDHVVFVGGEEFGGKVNGEVVGWLR